MHRVLVVEDHLESRQAIALHLADAGYAVSVAGNGWEALLAIQNSNVDLILLDLMMPGMDGITFLKIMRGQEPRHLPAIVITALEVDEAINKTLEYDITRVIKKMPDFYDELVKAVRQVLPDQRATTPD